MIYRIATGAAFVLCCILFVWLLVWPGHYVQTFGVPPDPASDFVARRAAPIFAGLAVILGFAITAPPSRLRTGVCAGLAVLWYGVALTGVADYTAGVATSAILRGVVVEVSLATLLALAAFRATPPRWRGFL